MIKKIISGGQTGPDRAALDLALEMGIPHGGWCTKGRVAEDGIISNKYHLTEIDSDDVAVRTKKNIDDSDGTIIFVGEWPLPKADGTILTKRYAEEVDKPVFLVSLSSQQDITSEFIIWITQHTISTLNVAGPRASNCSGIYENTLDRFREMMRQVMDAGS